MGETYYVFTDEAGAYKKRPSETFRRSHPLVFDFPLMITGSSKMKYKS